MTPVLDFGRDRFDLCLFVGRREKDCEKLVLEKPGLDFREPLEETIQIPMFSETRAENGTLYLTAVVRRSCPCSDAQCQIAHPFSFCKFNTDLNGCKKLRSNLYSSSVSLIHYKPQSRLESRFLIGGEDTPQAPPTFSDEYVAHWKHWAMTRFNFGALVSQYLSYQVKLRVVLDQNHYEARRPAKYSPTIYFDELHLAKRSLAPLSRNASREVNRCIFRILATKLMCFLFCRIQSFGFAIYPSGCPCFVSFTRWNNPLHRCASLDFPTTTWTVRRFKLALFHFFTCRYAEILQLMSPDRMYVLLGTYIVSFLHALFAGLAFKNEVAFWRGAKDLYGMSKRSVIGNAVCR